MRLSRRFKSLGIVFGILFLTMCLQVYFAYPPIQRASSIRINEDEYNLYKIQTVFEEGSMTLKSTQTITFKNNLDSRFENIYFHIYPNIFKKKKNVPFEEGDMEFVYPNGFNPGWIKINNVKENNKLIYHKVMGDGETVLRVTPQKAIEVGEERTFEIDFEVKLPNVLARMGYGDNTVNITNWYPILAVYDQQGWNLDPYYAIGDPFYSEVAKYEVTIDIPSEYILATTGNIESKKEKGTITTYKVKTEGVRDFGMILSKDFDVQETVVGGTTVQSYTIKGEKKEVALEVAADSLEIFNRIFGKYPYQQLSVVACDFSLGGMEYPNLVMIGDSLYTMEEDFPLEYVIAHEIAHQWWYGIVGNNEVTEPWLDEALTEYSTLLYFEEKYGTHIKEQIQEKMIKAQYENFLDLKPDKGEGIMRSLDEFDNSLEYSSIVYSRGALFIDHLRKEMGDENFRKAIKDYYAAYKFKNATTKNFYTILQKNSGKDLKPVFEEWLNVKFE